MAKDFTKGTSRPAEAKYKVRAVIDQSLWFKKGDIFWANDWPRSTSTSMDNGFYIHTCRYPGSGPNHPLTQVDWKAKPTNIQFYRNEFEIIETYDNEGKSVKAETKMENKFVIYDDGEYEYNTHYTLDSALERVKELQKCGGGCIIVYKAIKATTNELIDID